METLSKAALRLISAVLFLVFFNTLGGRYDLSLPLNLFNIIVLACFGIPGFIFLAIITWF